MSKVAERLAVLGQVVRLRLVEQLAGGAATPQELADALGLSQQNVSKHLQILHRSGLVTRRPDGANVFYALKDESTVKLLGGEQLLRLGDQRGVMKPRDAAQPGDDRRVDPAQSHARGAEVEDRVPGRVQRGDRGAGGNGLPVSSVAARTSSTFGSPSTTAATASPPSSTSPSSATAPPPSPSTSPRAATSRYNEWEAQDGTKRSRHEVIGSITFGPDRPRDTDDGADSEPES